MTPTADRDRFRSLYAATREVMAARTVEGLAEAVVATAEAVVGVPSVGVHLERAGRLVPIVVSEAVERQFDGDPPVYGRGHPAWTAYADRRTVQTDGRGRRSSGALVAIDGHGVLRVEARDSDGLDDRDLELVRLLAANAAVALDRLDRERRLDRLHEATRQLMTATDTAGVAATATDTAHEVLGMAINAVFLRVGGERRLVPVGVTAEARELFPDGVPDLDADSLAWETYRAGEPAVYDDVRETERANEGTPLRSELLLPLGDHGVFLAGSTEAGAFAESDLGLARVFAANVEAALDSAERKFRLRRRESELQRQNDRLEEFASVVSHDLRNPLNVAAGQVELAAARTDDERVAKRLAEADTAHDRMATLIDDLLSLARAGRSIGETEPVDPGRLAREEWDATGGATLAVAEPEAVVADSSRLRELLGNLLRNAVDHGASDVSVRLGSLSGEPGFYVADDGPGIPASDREAVFDHGFTTDEDGTGYGLTIVADVAEAHGWDVSVTDSAAGGARFEIRTDPAH